MSVSDSLMRNSPAQSNAPPPELRELFEIADFIGGAQPHMKPCMKTKSFVHAGSWSGSVYRWMYSESGLVTAHEFQRYAERFSSAVNSRRGAAGTKYDDGWHHVVAEKAALFLTGLKAIRLTYGENITVRAMMQTAIMTLEKCLVDT